jgi:hypothetical protein
MNTTQNTTRKPRTARRPTNDAKIVEELHPSDKPWVNEKPMSSMEQFELARDQLLKDLGVSSWKRATVAFISSLAAAGAVGYGVAAVTEVAMISALLLTGSGFVAFMVWLLGCLVAVYAGLKISGKVARYIIDEQIDRDLARARDVVVGVKESIVSFFGGLRHVRQ